MIEIEFAGAKRKFEIIRGRDSMVETFDRMNGLNKPMKLDTLEKKLGSPFAVAQRLQRGIWESDDIYWPIFIGLQGGGMATKAAKTLCEEWVNGRPLAENVNVALGVMTALLFGEKADAAGQVE